MDDLRKPDACPQCGRGRIVPIMHGLPEEHVMEQADRGEVILGGCVHFVETDPDRRCPTCGQPCPRYRKTCKHRDFEVGREP